MPKKPQIDETALGFEQLLQILPQGALEELGRNLLADIMQAPPAFHLAGGDALLTSAFTYILGEESMYEIRISDIPLEKSREWLRDEIDGNMEYIEEDMEAMGINRDEMADKIGMLIISSVNGDDNFHNYAINLMEGLGEMAQGNNLGRISGDEGAMEWAQEYIEKQMERASTPQLRYYCKGVLVHMKVLEGSDSFSVFDEFMAFFNDALRVLGKDQFRLVWNEWNADSDRDAIKKAFEYLTDPMVFLRESGVKINLEVYEEQHGKLPRQYDLPGMSETVKKEEGR